MTGNKESTKHGLKCKTLGGVVIKVNIKDVWSKAFNNADDHYPKIILGAVVGNGRQTLKYRRARCVRAHVRVTHASTSYGRGHGAVLENMAYRTYGENRLPPITLERKRFSTSYTIRSFSMPCITRRTPYSNIKTFLVDCRA